MSDDAAQKNRRDDQKKASSNRPSLTPKAAASKAERAERIALEMRNNLMKRKRQQRGKQGAP